MSQAVSFAHFLGSLRKKGKIVPIEAAEALLLIAAGIDNMTSLRQAMADTEGIPLAVSSASRLISQLRGKARYSQGKWIESPHASLVTVRSHPHTKGMQLKLTPEGKELIEQYLPTTTTNVHFTDGSAPIFDDPLV